MDAVIEGFMFLCIYAFMNLGVYGLVCIFIYSLLYVIVLFLYNKIEYTSLLYNSSVLSIQSLSK